MEKELSKKTKERIEQKALKRYGDPDKVKTQREMERRAIQNACYVSGATAEALRSQQLVEALEGIIMQTCVDGGGNLTNKVNSIANEALRKYNGIEEYSTENNQNS